MKTDASMQSSFLFNPPMSLADSWSIPQQPEPRRVARPLGLGMETQIDHKQEVVCGVILMLCLLFGMAAFVAQFVLA